MKVFTVAFPTSGYQVFTVEAENEELALEKVLAGECETETEFQCMETDFDSNLADIEEEF